MNTSVYNSPLGGVPTKRRIIEAETARPVSERRPRMSVVWVGGTHDSPTREQSGRWGCLGHKEARGPRAARFLFPA